MSDRRRRANGKRRTWGSAWLPLVAALTVASACTADLTDPGRTAAPISDGVPDPGRDAVVYLSNLSAQTACTGSVIGSRLVLTAKHCVDDGTQAPAPAAAFRILVGPSRTETKAVYYVSEVRVVPGSWDVSAGNDVAVLISTAPIAVDPMPLSFDSPLQLPGTTVTAVGYGETPSGTSGTKMTTQTTVTRVDSHFIWVEPSICPGDSGGPVIGDGGRVWGVASFTQSEVGSCGFPGAYTAIDPFEAFLTTALADSEACSVQGAELCNGRDDNCDGQVDEGCTPLGEPCTADDQCVGGACGDTPAGRLCSRPCNPLEPDVGCPPAMYCALATACAGYCVPGMQARDAAGLGDPCTADIDCASLFCHDPGDGQARCLQPCRADEGLCLAGEACSSASGCGGCLPVADVPAPYGLGEPCGGGGDCRSGLCYHERGLSYCSRDCGADADCGDGFHCRASVDTGMDVCIRGPRQDVGGGCVRTGDCAGGAVCASAGGLSWCTEVCVAGGCPDGFACSTSSQPTVCEPRLSLVGEACGSNGDCVSNLCAITATGSVCTRFCGPDRQCAPGLECVRVDARGSAVCLPPPAPSGGGGGGCAVAGVPGGRSAGGVAWIALLLGLALMRRRRPKRGWAGPAAVASVAALVLAGGCSDLSEFKTSPDEAYVGRVLGTNDYDAGASFIRRGFEEGTVMTLTFDPDNADSTNAGTISTDDAASACGRTFDGTTLRAIAPLQHDQLSLFDFPGATRLQNYIYAAQPSAGPLAGRDVSVYVSLVRGGGIDVRVIAGFGANGCGACDCYFGVFELDQQKVTP